MRRVMLAIAMAVAATAPARAQDEAAALAGLEFQTGSIDIGNNLATIALTPSFKFIDAAGTETFLTKVWGNPPGAGEGTLGMILPANVDLLGAAGWGIVVSYDNSGHVSDEDAAEIDYDALLAEMREATRQDSEQRVKDGYESIELVDWARPPFYDGAAKKLHWAKRLRFGETKDDVLNYNVRVLGRVGVIDLNVIGGMDQLDMIDGRIGDVLAMVNFKPGHTYVEFDPDIDEVAGYGIAGLIAGGLLAKAGFFKLLAPFMKFIVIGAIAAAGVGIVRKRMRRRAEPG